MSPPFVPGHRPGRDRADLRAFLDRLQRAPAPLRPGRPTVVTRAPGRLDVIGGIADYSGSLVLELPLGEAAFVALQRRDDAGLRIVSPCAGGSRSARFETSLDELPVDEDAARVRWTAVPADRWVAYVAGAFVVLARTLGRRFQTGADILVDSRLPEGKGLASSAAVEVATMRAVAAAWNLALPPHELALLCQAVENRVAGVPCGVMDQMTAVLGRQGRLLALRCQPCAVEGQVEVPAGLACWGIDSGARHDVGGAAYRRARTAAFMGYRMLAQLRGCRASCEGGRVRVDDPEWGGWVARCEPSRFDAGLAAALPVTMRGSAFLARFGGITDDATDVSPQETYPVRAATAHPIAENARARRFRRLLAGRIDRRTVAALGRLMFASHDGYSRCGLGSPETDWIVDRVRAAAARGEAVYGAKTTGGGCGGTVAVLGERARGGATVARITAEHAARTGASPRVFGTSSDGSAAFGVLRLDPASGTRARPCS